MFVDFGCYLVGCLWVDLVGCLGGLLLVGGVGVAVGLGLGFGEFRVWLCGFCGWVGCCGLWGWACALVAFVGLVTWLGVSCVCVL